MPGVYKHVEREENGINITFSEVNRSKKGNVPDHVQRILDADEKLKHFLVVHTFVSDEARRQILTPPEKRNPPQKKDTERDWVQFAKSGQYAKIVQHWITNEDFFSVILLIGMRLIFTGSLWTPILRKNTSI